MKLAKRIRWSLVTIGLVASGSVFAASGEATEKAKAKKVVIPLSEFRDEVVAYQLDDTNEITPADAIELAKTTASDSKRVPADALDVSPAFAEFRTRFLSATTADQLDEKIFAYYKGDRFQKLSPDMQFFLLQLSTLEPMRGIVWRLRPLVEAGGIFSGSKAIHSQAVTMLRSLAAQMKILAPNAQWEAGFDYITTPSHSMTLESQFRSVSDVQNFAMLTLRPKISQSITGTRRIYDTMTKAGQPINFVWDNKVTFGDGTFEDKIQRYFAFGRPEILTVLASQEMSLYSIYLFSAFDLNASIKFAGSLAKSQGAEGFFPGQDLGVTARDKAKILKSYAERGYLRLKPAMKNRPGGDAILKSAYSRLYNAALYYRVAFELLRASGDTNPDAVLNAGAFQANQQPMLETAVKNMVRAVNGSGEEFRSPITGERARFDIKGFLTGNHEPEFTLASFIPTEFKSTPATSSFTNAQNQKIEYRNYTGGSAIRWDARAWSRLVKSCGANSDCVPEAARVVKHTPGLSFMNTFFSSFVY